VCLYQIGKHCVFLVSVSLRGADSLAGRSCDQGPSVNLLLPRWFGWSPFSCHGALCVSLRPHIHSLPFQPQSDKLFFYSLRYIKFRPIRTLMSFSVLHRVYPPEKRTANYYGTALLPRLTPAALAIKLLFRDMRNFDSLPVPFYWNVLPRS